MDELKLLRDEIDVIDRQIAALFQQRMDVTYRVGQYKVRNNMNVLDESREKEVLAAKAALTDDPAMQGDLTTLFEGIMSISRKQQRRLVQENDPWFDRYLEDRSEIRTPLSNPRVLYQGEPGAYADEAAALFFGEELPRQKVRTWEEIFVALKEGRADYGVVPIENSSTGSINQVYDLLARTVARMICAAAEKTGISQVLIAGGVSSSTLFRELVTERIRKRDRELHVCFGKPEYSGDNAVGTALIGAEMLRQRGKIC